ncbi:alpha/beta hydrolase [Granulosicoccaceae sp. 1_MG-2023]|nr:alpha/beta hydrolase [Granulosicoccaceae sp. 1_MG-2023]
MSTTLPQFNAVPGSTPAVVFCGGFRSDMTGSKALALQALATQQGFAFTRFDYRGHGSSPVPFEACTVSDWLQDTLTIIDQQNAGKLILVGSSMGAWLALLAACRRPQRVAGLLLIAAATDFTAELMEPALSDTQRAQLARDGLIRLPSAYDADGYPVTQQLLEDGRRHRLLDKPIPLHCPVRLLHGLADADVPWSLSLRTQQQLQSTDVTLELIKGGDHRLSTDADLARIARRLCELRAQVQGNARD